MIEITTDTYRTVASRLRDGISTSEWYNGSLDIDIDSLHCTLLLTAIVYRRTELLPEGGRRPIADIVPVWWEFSTAGPQGPEPNDFAFSELKPFLIDND
jgi:hypothetical protein